MSTIIKENGNARAVLESSEEYNAAPGHRATALSVLLKSPKRYKYEVIDGNRKKETPALRFGQIAHIAILEREKFEERFIIEPEFKGTGMRAAKADWLAAQRPDAIILDADEMETINGMIHSVADYEPAFSLLKNGVPEVSLYWTDEETGLACKARPDYLAPCEKMKGDWIVNIKTSRDASFWKFTNAIRDYSYHIQAAHYLAGYRAVYGKDAVGYAMIPIEKEPPYEVAVYAANSTVIDKGNSDIRKALERYKQCVETGIWPGLQEQPQDIAIPNGMMVEY